MINSSNRLSDLSKSEAVARILFRPSSTISSASSDLREESNLEAFSDGFMVSSRGATKAFQPGAPTHSG
jgi:hypothetical protein